MMACTLERVHTYSQPVKIQSLVDASTYWLIPDQKEPPGNKIDRILTERIRKTNYNDFLPQKEQMVAVMDATTNVWHRGKVKIIFLGEHDHRYLVFLVDYGIDLKVAHHLVRELPTDVIFQKEHHATQFKLYGVVPCKKQVACLLDFKLVSVSGKEWDPIAYTFIVNKSKAATAIYISPLKGIDLCDGDVIQGDLHCVIGGRCISMIDDLCSNQYAIYDEVLFKNNSAILKEEESKPQTAYNQMEPENLPAACSGGLIAIEPCSSYGKGRLSITNTSMKTPLQSSWIYPSKEPVLLPGGINLNILSQKTKKQTWSCTSKHEDKSPCGTNNPMSTRRNTATIPNTSPFTTHNITKQQNASFSPRSTVVESTKDVTEESPNEGVGRMASKLSGSTSSCSNETNSSLKTIQGIYVSPKTTNDVAEQLHNVVNPVSPDSAQQCVTARDRRFQGFTAIEAKFVSHKTTNDVAEQLHNVVNPVSPDSAQQSVTTRGQRFQASTTIQAVNVSPKTKNDVPEQLHNVVNPVSPDSAQQCVTARGRRFQAMFKDQATMREKGKANESLEEASLISLLDSLNNLGTGSSSSGLLSQIKTAFNRSQTESSDSNSGFTPVNSSRSLNPTNTRPTPSNTSGTNVAKSKFLSLLDDLDPNI